MEHRRHHRSSSSVGSSQKVYLPHVKSVPSSRKRPHPSEPPHSHHHQPKPADDDMFAVTPEHFQLAKKKLQLEREGQIGGSGLPIPVVPTSGRRSTGSVPLPSEDRTTYTSTTTTGHHRPGAPLGFRSITSDRKLETATPTRRASSTDLSSPHNTRVSGSFGSESTEELDAETQQILGFFGCSLIRRAATLLRVPQNTVTTAQVYFHRFYAFHSMKHFDVVPIASCCLYLACKSEESLKKARDVLNTITYVINPTGPALKIDKTYWNLRDEMVAAEGILLRVLAFNVTVEQPFTYLLNYVYSLRGSEALAKVAWSILCDAFYGPTFIDVPPGLLACASIHLAAQILEERLLPQITTAPWYEAFDYTKAEVEKLSESLLSALEEFLGLPFPAAVSIYKIYTLTFPLQPILSVVKPALTPVTTKPIVP